MADLNKLMESVFSRTQKLQVDLKNILRDYENLYKESHIQFITERSAADSMQGLEEFYRLVNIIRRNRDIIGSLNRGIRGLRPLDKFKFIEELESEKKSRTKKEKVNENSLLALSIPEDFAVEEDING